MADEVDDSELGMEDDGIVVMENSGASDRRAGCLDGSKETLYEGSVFEGDNEVKGGVVGYN